MHLIVSDPKLAEHILEGLALNSASSRSDLVEYTPARYWDRDTFFASDVEFEGELCSSQL